MLESASRRGSWTACPVVSNTKCNTLDRKKIKRGGVVDRNPGTVSRELARNGHRHGYRAVGAHERALRARQRPWRARKLAARPHSRLRQLVLRKLRQRHSPQQIGAWLRRTYPDQPTRWVSHQTIYTSIAILPKGELKRELLRYLRRQGKAGARPALKDRPWVRQSIHDRPQEAQARRLPGHWEADLLLGKAAGGAAVRVLVERVSRHCAWSSSNATMRSAPTRVFGANSPRSLRTGD